LGVPGSLAPEAESIFGLGIGTYNGSGKFRALGHVPLPPSPWIRHWFRGRAQVGVWGRSLPEAENFTINL